MATTTDTKASFSAAERAAMKERAKELKASTDRAEGEAAVAEKIAAMPEPDRSLAQRIHEIVTEVAPTLVPRTYYGMPAYAKDGKVLCFFKPASKFKMRYSTFGFNDVAQLDDGTMWPSEFAVTALTADDEARVAELVRRAVG
ncbi:iron chaperone [Luteimicrobium sp. DT211]|uniref:iron chaperone n=1 Tax=Luteimicrobium sp. DT211 TaxID=3393412 RepID=UPI003CF84A2C